MIQVIHSLLTCDNMNSDLSLRDNMDISKCHVSVAGMNLKLCGMWYKSFSNPRHTLLLSFVHNNQTMKRGHDDPESPLSSLDSQEELSEEELEDEWDDDIVNPEVDELGDMEEDDDLDDLSDEVQSPMPESSKKRKSVKRKRPGKIQSGWIK